METKTSSGLYPWTKDLEASSDVRLREIPAFAMFLGWLEKFVCNKGLQLCAPIWNSDRITDLNTGWC
jgi:hypothetical protein